MSMAPIQLLEQSQTRTMKQYEDLSSVYMNQDLLTYLHNGGTLADLREVAKDLNTWADNYSLTQMDTIELANEQNEWLDQQYHNV